MPGRVRAGRQGRLLTAAAVVVVAAAGGTAVWWWQRPQPAAAEATRTVTASTGTMRLTTAATGTLAPAQRADLSFTAGGRVSSVLVTEGQRVTAGQKLATIESAALAAQQAQARAGLASAQARLAADQASAGAAQLDADRAAVTAAGSALADATAALGDATMTSPIAGTVAQVSLTVGQQVTGSGGSAGSGGGSSGGNSSGGNSSGGNSSGGNSSAQVVVIGAAFVVDLGVDSTQIDLVKRGEQAVIGPQGSSTPQYGTVTSVGLLGSATSGVTTFPVTVTVTGTPTGLFSGQTASVSIVYRQLNDVLRVPTAAIRYAGRSPYVLLAGSGGGTRRDVAVGPSTGGFTQVTSGLAEGAQVLVPVSTPGGAPGRSETGQGTGGERRGGFGGGGFGGGGSGGGFGGPRSGGAGNGG